MKMLKNVVKEFFNKKALIFSLIVSAILTVFLMVFNSPMGPIKPLPVSHEANQPPPPSAMEKILAANTKLMNDPKARKANRRKKATFKELLKAEPDGPRKIKLQESITAIELIQQQLDEFNGAAANWDGSQSRMPGSKEIPLPESDFYKDKKASEIYRDLVIYARLKERAFCLSSLDKLGRASQQYLEGCSEDFEDEFLRWYTERASDRYSQKR